jgi:hypothetical protein
MQFFSNTALQRAISLVNSLGMASRVAARALPIISIILMAQPGPARAQTKTLGQSSSYVVENDRGGLMLKRLAQIRALRQSGQPVRITGGICYSTCTMLVGLPQTCITPDVRFGFHGPSSHGRALTPETFERASEIIASFYPKPLRRWYMSKGRYRIHGLYYIDGTQMIRLGVPAC